MSFNEKVLGGNYDTVAVMTDMEPDDILAFHVMAGALNAAPKRFVVVGEGSVAKRDMCQNMLADLGVNAPVIDGCESGKDFPLSLVTAFGMPIASSSAERNKDQVAPTMESLLASSESPLVICIKPPRELLNISSQLQEKLTVVCYGGFNFRALNTHRNEWQALVNMRFKETIVYESFLVTGPQNSLSAANSLLFARAIAAAKTDSMTSGFWRGLLNAVKLWNAHIAFDCLETVEVLAKQMRDDLAREDWDALRSKKMRLEDRNLKVVASIIDAESCQMVLADCALAAALCTAVPVTVRRGQSLSFDSNGYSRFEASDGGRVGVFEPVPFATMIEWIEAACRFD